MLWMGIIDRILSRLINLPLVSSPDTLSSILLRFNCFKLFHCLILLYSCLLVSLDAGFLRWFLYVFPNATRFHWKSRIMVGTSEPFNSAPWLAKSLVMIMMMMMMMMMMIDDAAPTCGGSLILVQLKERFLNANMSEVPYRVPQGCRVFIRKMQIDSWPVNNYIIIRTIHNDTQWIVDGVHKTFVRTSHLYASQTFGKDINKHLRTTFPNLWSTWCLTIFHPAS